MFLIGLMLISLVAIMIVTEVKSSTAEQAEFIPVPVRNSQVNNLRKFN